MDKMNIREMVSSDLNDVVRVHHKAFKGFFLDKMGTSFLKSYYTCVLNYEGSIAIISLDSKNCLNGFAVGFKDPKIFYKEFSATKRKLILPIISGLIRNPNLILEILYNILRISKTDEFADNTVELSSIAVGEHGKGLGGLLLEEFIRISWISNSKQIYLTTDLKNNENTNNFYKKYGFNQTGIEKRRNRSLVRYMLINSNS